MDLCLAHFYVFYVRMLWYIYILIRYWVVPCVFSCAIETTFLLSNFKTKHIFGILKALRKSRDHLGRHRRPNFFFYRRRRRRFPQKAPSQGDGNAAKGGCFANIYINIYHNMGYHSMYISTSPGGILSCHFCT